MVRGLKVAEQPGYPERSGRLWASSGAPWAAAALGGTAGPGASSATFLARLVVSFGSTRRRAAPFGPVRVLQRASLICPPTRGISVT